jgi:hypothetical protein
MNSGSVTSFIGSIQVEATTNVTLLSGSRLIAPEGDISISAKNFNATNAEVAPGRGLVLALTGNLLAGTNTWTVRDGFSLLSKPTLGDFTATTVSNVALPYANPQSWWAGADRGASLTGFTNNAALGRLILDGGANSLFTFQGTGPSSNALYVDVLVLANSAADTDADGNLVALDVRPGMKIYYAKAFANDVDITADLIGKNGGSLAQLSHNGLFTTPADGVLTKPASYDIDLKVAMESGSANSLKVTWNTKAGATNTLYALNPSQGNGWVKVTNFVSATSGRVSYSEPISAGSGRFFKVRVDRP